MLKNILLIIEYDGTNYSGWQSQKNACAIQDVTEAALSVLHGGQKVPLIGCSRTDSGVHASGYCANFRSALTIPPEKFCYALNNLLPDDIRIVASRQVPEDFHARFSVKSKTYCYRFYTGRFASPLRANRAWHVKGDLTLSAMQHAAAQLLGTHDFSAFMAAGGYAGTTVRTLFDAGVTFSEETGLYTVSVTGDGFLYNMVRIIAGTLVYVGLGKLPADGISEIILGKDRKKAGITAPACGLYLDHVNYS